VQQDFLDAVLLESHGDRGRLDELGPIADNRKDFQVDAESTGPS
jgi:hypothetical protein